MPYLPKVHVADATDETRAAFREVCTELAVEPGIAGPTEGDISLTTRADLPDRRAVGLIAEKLKVTRQAVQLLAFRLGMEAIGEVVRERSHG